MNVTPGQVKVTVIRESRAVKLSEVKNSIRESIYK